MEQINSSSGASAVHTRKIVLAAVMASLTVAGSALRITLPIEIAGTTSFHLGNIMCALCGILLGPGMGGLAAGLGSAIYDMTNPLYISEAWITFLFKGAYGLTAGLVAHYGRRVSLKYSSTFAAAAGALVYAVLYLAKSFFYNGLLLSGLTPQAAGITILSKLPATVFNAAIAVIVAPILAESIRKALEKNHFSLP